MKQSAPEDPSQSDLHLRKARWPERLFQEHPEKRNTSAWLNKQPPRLLKDRSWENANEGSGDRHCEVLRARRHLYTLRPGLRYDGRVGLGSEGHVRLSGKLLLILTLTVITALQFCNQTSALFIT